MNVNISFFVVEIIVKFQFQNNLLLRKISIKRQGLSLMMLHLHM